MKLILILAALLAGCSSSADNKPAAGVDDRYETNFWLYKDLETGCEYVSNRSSNSGLTPRIAADGKTHLGCKAAK